MAFRQINGGNGSGGGATNLRGMAVGEYSGDDRESRSGGEEHLDADLHEKPTYLLEHLATFTVNKESGIIYPADGMRRLLQLEKTTGIWSQKMQLCLDQQWVLIMDYESGNVIERFPATLIQEPTAFTSTDAMELYNNILVFIVSGGSDSRSEMHIFQSQNVSAVHLVEDLKNLRSGKIVTQQRELTHHQQHQLQHTDTFGVGLTGKSHLTANHSRINENNQLQQHHHGHQQHQQSNRSTTEQQYGLRSAEMLAMIGNGETDSEHGGVNDETSSTSSDKYERDVTVLNHCFDDIEKFIARLQHAAAATRELERRRRNRKTKKKDPGEGLLTLRTRPPHEKEFIDIFAKFKLSFNLLAKLKAHIHDPNAPELVHFLFTPLALIVEAASDTYYESQLPARVINPLLTREAINLLVNCVTSKETELWRSLGDAWTIPRDQWKEDIGSYHPVFLDGWSPDYLVVDELEPQASSLGNSGKRQGYQVGSSAFSSNVNRSERTTTGYDDFDSVHEKYAIHHSLHGGHSAVNDRTERGVMERKRDRSGSIDSMERNGSSNTNNNNNNNVLGHDAMQLISTGIQNVHMRSDGPGKSYESNIATAGGAVKIPRGGVGVDVNASHSGDESQLELWLDHLQANGSKIVLVTYPRSANNDKELSVVRGEYLEILDDSRKWWKARNMRGQIAHVPHTIVTPYIYGEVDNSQQQQNNKSRTVSSPKENDTSEQHSNGSPYWQRSDHLAPRNSNNLTTPQSDGVNVSCGGGIHEELQHVLNVRSRRSDLDIHKTPVIYIHQKSTASDVAMWLRAKQFSEVIVNDLERFTGEDLFALTTKQLEELFGIREGRRLASQIKLQKSVSGYKTARTAEFQAVLARARPKSELPPN